MNRLLHIGLLLTISSAISAAGDLAGIPRDRLPPAGWADTQWVDPGGWKKVDVTQHGLRADDEKTDAAAKVREILAAHPQERIILFFPRGVYYFASSLVKGVTAFNAVDTPEELAATDTWDAANWIGGKEQWGQLNAGARLPASLYLTQRPAFLGAAKPWPLFGPAVTGVGPWGKDNTLSADDRFQSDRTDKRNP